MNNVATEQAMVRIGRLAESDTLPLLVEPADSSLTLQAAFEDLAAVVDAQLEHVGAILFRGFRDPGREGFREFAAAFGHPLLNYDFASTPRSELSKGVYTATEYPPHQRIPLHNEQAYTLDWPLKIWFYCEQPAQQGGETPIADSRRIFQRLDPELRRRFAVRGLKYVRNYGNGLDLPWQRVFGTEDRNKVESYCRSHRIHWEWKRDGELRTSQVCQAIAQHPRTRAEVWFNQAHLFHVSGLEPAVREALLEVVEPQDLPRNVYYGDGTPIEDSALETVRGVLDEVKVIFPWRAADVLLLDNMLTAHARSTFKGPRKVLVAMTESHSA